MKLTGREGARFCRAPDAAKCGALLYGQDAAMVAEARQALVAALSEGDDFRITRLSADDIRRDPAGLDAELRARGFFPGRRVVVVAGARDSLASAVKEILAEIKPEDAFLVLEADALAARSALRKLFEGAANLVSIAFYPSAVGADEIVELATAAGLKAPLDPDARAALSAVAAEIDRGAMRPFAEKLALFAGDQTAPLTGAEITTLAPAAGEAEFDRLVAAVAGGKPHDVAPLLSRLPSGTSTATQAMISVGRHFRQLLTVAASPDGTEAALGRLRPPVYGPRRREMADQVRAWGPRRLETAVRLVHQTETALRSAGDRPSMAIAERCLIRLSMMGAR